MNVHTNLMIAMEVLEKATDALVEAQQTNSSPAVIAAATTKYNDAKNEMAVAMSKVNASVQGGRRRRKSRKSRRRRTLRK